MIKLFKRIAIGVCFLLSLLTPVGAVAEDVLNPICTTTPEATICQENQQDETQDRNSIFGENGIMTKAARLIALAVGVAAVIMVVVGGIQYVVSAGDPTNVNNAKNTILYAIIGLVVALLAQAIIRFVLVRL